MSSNILVTGSEGLVGTALSTELAGQGQSIHRLDVRARDEEVRGDVTIQSDVRRRVAGCRGIIHLAAVSRVVWGERDPQRCQVTNIEGTRNVIEAALSTTPRPWLIFASSREVYGQCATLPVREGTPLMPLNTYGRSKAEGERLCEAARQAGLRVAVVRLSNVYGSTRDHVDRVIPAFARAAVEGSPLRVEGRSHTFDFTHIDDTVRGLMALAQLLDREAPPPPIHFVTGTPTTLGEAAELAKKLSQSSSPLLVAEARTFDVSRFYGDPQRAQRLLGWTAQVGFREGLARLITDFQVERHHISCGVAS